MCRPAHHIPRLFCNQLSRKAFKKSENCRGPALSKQKEPGKYDKLHAFNGYHNYYQPYFEVLSIAESSDILKIHEEEPLRSSLSWKYGNE